MKVLIVGQGNFRDLLADRLKREKHDVYLLSSEEDAKPSRFIHYHFPLTNERLDFTVHSVQPEAVVFMGALDETYDFNTGRRAAMAYMAGLINLLAVTGELQVPRFVYLSSAMVYGSQHVPDIVESAEKSPDDLRALVVSDGETLCMEFGSVSQTNVNCLRFSDLYGTGTLGFDSLAPAFAQAMDPQRDPAKPFAPKQNKRFSPLFISDAVEAVFRVLTSERETGGIYNVSAPAMELADIYRGIGALTNVPASPCDPPQLDETVNSAAFAQAYGFQAIVDLDTGLERTYRTMLKQAKRKKRESKETTEKSKTLWQRVRPLLENLLVFAAAVALTLSAEGGGAFAEVNFLIIYVVIVAITFGIFQSSIAIILGGVFMMWQASRGVGFFEIIIDLSMTLRILELVVVGVICGYARDRMNTVLYEKNQVLEDQIKEIETINEINESNITIKRTLDDRLKNYEDSLAKIYSIVDKLNSLSPDAVFFSAVSVVMEIMKATDVSIYIVTGEEYRICRLMAETQSSTRVTRKSVPLEELSQLTESFSKGEIFANHSLLEGLPMMAAPIYSKGELVSIIMLWAVPFDGLSPYNVNRFFVLAQLVSSIIERAYIHSQSMSETMFAPGLSGIMTAGAFSEMYATHREAARSNTTSCAMLRVRPGNGQGMSPETFAQQVKALLRSTDYVGLSDREDGMLRILLSNTSEAEIRFVRDRLEKSGIAIEEVVA